MAGAGRFTQKFHGLFKRAMDMANKRRATRYDKSVRDVVQILLGFRR